jgi:hypothetical protein
LTVAAAVEAVSLGLARRRGDGADAAQRSECGFAGEPFGVVAGGDEELAGDVGADAEVCEESGCCSASEGFEFGVKFVDLVVEREPSAGEVLERTAGRLERIRVLRHTESGATLDTLRGG